MLEAICIPGTMDNPGEVENQILARHSRVQVDSFLPEVSNHGADKQDSAGMVDKQAGSEALLRDAKPETPIHARDR